MVVVVNGKVAAKAKEKRHKKPPQSPSALASVRAATAFPRLQVAGSLSLCVYVDCFLLFLLFMLLCVSVSSTAPGGGDDCIFPASKREYVLTYNKQKQAKTKVRRHSIDSTPLPSPLLLAGWVFSRFRPIP